MYRNFTFNTVDHRLNMENGDRSLKFIWAPVYSCTHWLRPRNSPPPPAFGLTYGDDIGQPRDRRHLFVTP